ncbi:MAG: condensation domain-containing protein [Actinophytocola sp.]|uniref:condensation domain-containing protein n=1 Tax=Actinophytocola sp. TaxID=1872138 RepID=UPI003C722F7B
MPDAPKIEDILPLTPLQEGVVFHAAYDTGAPDVYAVQVAVDLEGDVDDGALRDAVTALVRRQPALRTSFRQVGERGVAQVVQSAARPVWREVDLTRAPATSAEAVAEEDRVRRFDLAVAPLVRFTLLRLGPRHRRLVLTNHHVLLDGWSMPLLMRELLALYHGHDPGGPAASMRAYFAWRGAQDEEAARAAWRDALAGVDGPTRLRPNADLRRPVMPDELAVRLPERTTAALTTRARALGTTTSTLVRAAWALLVSGLTGRADVVFGATVAGRPPDVPGIESQLGLFINTVPVRVRVLPGDSLAELVARIQDDRAALLPHEFLGLRDIQELSGIEGDLFDSVVVFENYPMTDLAGHGEPRITAVSTHNRTHYPLTVLVLPGSALEVRFGYRPDLFDADEVARVAERFLRVLRTVAEADPATPAARVDLLLPEERRQMLTDWNDTARPAGHRSVVDRFRAHAEATPDRVAVVFGAESVTYAELADRVADLAGELAARGVGREDVVAIGLPRSVDLVVAVLAVLNAGAAYLPLDPTHPPERLAHVLRDAAPVLLLTSDRTATRIPAGNVPRLVVGTPVPVPG